MAAQTVRVGRVNEVLFDTRRGNPVTVEIDRKDATAFYGTTVTMLYQNGENYGGMGTVALPGHLFVEPTNLASIAVARSSGYREVELLTREVEIGGQLRDMIRYTAHRP